jgi:4-carboxymuconolactone decarboxylase
MNAGVDQAVIDVVKFRRPVTTVAARDALVIQLGREAFRNRAVGLNTFNEALNVFGAKNLVDIVSVFGEYSSMAVLLNVFDQRLRDSQAPLLPVQ